jgi:fatty acid desaturase
MYYRTKVPADALKQLHVRNDLQGWARCFGHALVLLVLGVCFVVASNNGWVLLAVVLLAVYGVVFSFLSWVGASHELQHNTVFQSKALNQCWLQIFAFLSWANPVYFTRAHATHHSHTLDSHLDEEVRTNVCSRIANLVLSSTIDIRRFWRTLRMQVLNARGIVPGQTEGRIFSDAEEDGRRRLANAARRLLVGQAALLVLFLTSGFWQGVFLVTLGPFIANGFANMLATAQHCGMKHNTLDYRESTRTILLSPFLSFLYWNMNYHVEHHMYPGVPCYNLPKLHELIAYDVAPPARGLRGALKVIRKDNRSRAVGDCSLN